MKAKQQTIKQKAEIAIDGLNYAAIVMHRQMKSGELNKAEADKYILRAQRKARATHNAYFSRKEHFDSASCKEHLRQIAEFGQSELYDEFKHVYDRFGKVLKHYAQAVGAKFQRT